MSPTAFAETPSTAARTRLSNCASPRSGGFQVGRESHSRAHTGGLVSSHSPSVRHHPPQAARDAWHSTTPQATSSSYCRPTSRDGGQERLHPMVIRVLGPHVFVRLFHHPPPALFIPKPLHRLLDVGKISFHADVVNVRLENPVVLALEQDLARLRADRFKMPGGDALS